MKILNTIMMIQSVQITQAHSVLQTQFFLVKDYTHLLPAVFVTVFSPFNSYPMNSILKYQFFRQSISFKNRFFSNFSLSNL